EPTAGLPGPAPAPGVPGDVVVARAAQVLGASVRPVIVAGGGARRAAVSVRRLAEALDAPVVTTVNGKGVLGEGHPLAIGAAIRLTAAQQLVNEADAVLVVGSELGDSDL